MQQPFSDGKTVHLLQNKSIRTVTVDDIVNAVGIGKGTFYTYYPSKEICLFEVIKRCEKELFSCLKELFLSENSFITSINPTDVEILLRKLPSEYRQRENEKSENNFQEALKMMGLDHQSMEVVALLTDSLGNYTHRKSLWIVRVWHYSYDDANFHCDSCLANFLVNNQQSFISW